MTVISRSRPRSAILVSRSMSQFFACESRHTGWPDHVLRPLVIRIFRCDCAKTVEVDTLTVAKCVDLSVGHDSHSRGAPLPTAAWWHEGLHCGDR